MSLLVKLLLVLMTLVAPARVGVVVYPRVTSKLVRARKLLRATRELASVRFLARMSTDMPSLMLEAMKGLIAERALVGARELIGVLRGLSSRQRPVGLDDGDGGAGHFVGLSRRLGFLVCHVGCWVK
jgi:hypothetical protein